MEVKLSQKTFKALANPTRIAILKELDKRNYTQSELAETLGFAVPTVKQHVQDLEKADLVEIIDEGRKWKYIKLTKDGKAILHPEEKKIWILLSTLGASIVGGIITATRKIVAPVTEKFAVVPEIAEESLAGAKTFAEETVKTTAVDSARTIAGPVATSASAPGSAPLLQEAVVQTAQAPVQAIAQETINQAVQVPIIPIITKTPEIISQTPILIYVFIGIAILSALGIVFYLIKRQKRLKWLGKVGGRK